MCLLDSGPRSLADRAGPALRVMRGVVGAGMVAVLVAAPREASAQSATATAIAAPVTGIATAEDPVKAGLVEPDAVSALARELNCPLCQGYNLQDCPLTVCAQMRMLIAQQLAAGMTPEEIRAGFVADYGTQVMNVPPTRGAWLLAWLAPGMALALAALWMGLRWRRRAAPSGGDAALDRAPADSDPERRDAGLDAGLDGDLEAGRQDLAARFEAMAQEDQP